MLFGHGQRSLSEFGVTKEHTLEIDPEIIRVEDLEFTDYVDEHV